ncbi:MAG: glucan endo-1,3-beta-D-glucosidase [Bacteroidia bacterium]|nr:glucan endo-1,3-beta-D-glucosidase [Bacteroidia bacterium]
MKKLIYIKSLLLLTMFVSCSEENYEFGQIIIPSKIEFSVEVLGADATNPYGDGTGQVVFKTTANNALAFKYIIEGVEYVSPSGRLSHLFTSSGLNEYTINIFAIGTAGVQSNLVQTVKVLVLYEPPAELLTMLHLNSQRTWRIKAEGPDHFGLGPGLGDDPFSWYSASPNEKSYTGMYDDRYVFNEDGTFTHVTNGTVFGFEEYLNNDIGASGEEANDLGEVDHYPLDDYSANWTLSAPAGQETLNLTGKAFIGMYVGGNHQYKIMSRTDNEMVLQTTEGDEEFDWHIRLIAED